MPRAPIESATAAGAPTPSPAPSRGAGLVRNTVWTLLGRAATYLGWALVTPLLLARLGTDRFAIWALVSSLSGLFAAFDLGVSQSLVRFVAEFTAAGDRRSLRAVVTLGTLVYAALGLLAIFVVVIAREPILDLLKTPGPLRAEAGWGLTGMAIVLAVSNLTGVGTALIAGRHRMDLSGGLLLATTVLQLTGVGIVLAIGGGIRELVVNAGIVQLVSGVVTLVFVQRLVPDLTLSLEGASRALFGRLLRFSGALQVTNLGALGQFQIDRVLLAHFVALAPVAHFELGTRLATALWLGPMLLLPPLVPAFARLAAEGEEVALRALYVRATRYLMAAGFPVAGYLVVAAPGLVGGWLGAGHRDVVAVAAVVGIFLLVTVLTGVTTAALRGMERPWPEAHFHLIGLTVHLALSFALVPRLGLAGALVALVVSAVVSAGWLQWTFHVGFDGAPGRWLGTAAWPLVCTLVGAGIAWWIPGGGWGVETVGRGPALARAAIQGVTMLAVIAAGYRFTGYLPASEFRQILAALSGSVPGSPGRPASKKATTAAGQARR